MLFFKKPKDQLILILDVQSSLVRGSLALVHGDSRKPSIVFTAESAIPFKPNTNSSYLIKRAIHSISETVQAASEHIHNRSDHAEQASDMPRKISAVHFVLSSPWIISQAKAIKTVFPKDTPVTKPRILEMVSGERAKLMDGKTYQLQIVEEKVFDVRLNGYSVADWEGKQAKEFETSFAVSVAGKRTVEMFAEACIRIVRKERIHFHSSLLLQYIGARAMLPGRNTYSLVHIHGELTDIAIADRNSCAFFGSYPLGIRTVVRKIAGAAKIDAGTADSLLNMHASGQLDDAHAQQTAEIVSVIGLEWGNGLKKVLATMSPSYSPPSPVVITGISHLDFFELQIKRAYPKAIVERQSVAADLYAVAINNMQRDPPVL